MSAAKVKRTWRPVVAGVMQMLACFPYIFFAIELFIWPRDLAPTAGGGLVPKVEGGHPVWAPIGVVVWLPFLLPLAIASVAAVTRRAWRLALVGGLLPLVLTVVLAPFAGTSIGTALLQYSPASQAAARAVELTTYGFLVLAAALLVWSRREFVGRTSATEYLYGPPKGWKRSDE